MAWLPRLLVLQSGGKYLSVTEENVPANLPSGFVKFDDEPIYSPRVKFAVELANMGDGRFVHIRSCYNKKYLVIQNIEADSWIVASAKKTEEDDSNDSCTLFEAYSLEGDQKTTTAVEGPSLEGDEKIPVEGDETSELEVNETTSVRIRPVMKSAMTSCLSCDGDTHQGMRVSSVGSVFKVINWRSVIILPTHVAFRSDHLDNNFGRSIFLYQNLIYQTFSESGLDIGDQRVSNQLTPNRDGAYYIYDRFTNTWWRRRDNWIKGERYDGTAREYLFRFVHLHGNMFALRSLGNNNFCGPITEDQSIDCLNAHFPTISGQTRMIIEEVVIRREISNIEYRLNDSRIYDEQMLEMSSAFGVNDTPAVNTMVLNFAVTESRTRSWTNSVSVNFGVTVSMEVSLVPFMATLGIETRTEFGVSHEWGGSHTTETRREANYTVTLPPFTRMRVAMMASTARCDVPFSYTQRDLLTSGNWVSTRKHDGVFSGVNSFGFDFQSAMMSSDNS